MKHNGVIHFVTCPPVKVEAETPEELQSAMLKATAERQSHANGMHIYSRITVDGHSYPDWTDTP